jgi:hypothetical protein
MREFRIVDAMADTDTDLEDEAETLEAEAVVDAPETPEIETPVPETPEAVNEVAPARAPRRRAPRKRAEPPVDEAAA